MHRIRIGNAQAFWGDRSSAAAELLSQVPDLDYLTMDYLAEVSMSILAQQRAKSPDLGYPLDFIGVIRSLTAYWSQGGQCKLIANSGGLNPRSCALACRDALQSAGCPPIKIAYVSGDDVLDQLQAPQDPPTHQSHFANLDDQRPLDQIRDRLVTANAYMGCQGIVSALRAGAQIVITGRVADPSMVLAACVHAFDWPLDDWDRLAQGTVAGHLLECGTQVCGGISTDWLDLPDPAHIGFPLVEIQSDSSFIVTKPEGSGGVVSEQTVKEQLLYEIGDPANYLSPDVCVSFLELNVQQQAPNRVAVTGARGSKRPETLKVSATFADGYRAAGTLTIIGAHATHKASRCAKILYQRLAEAGWCYRQWIVECLGQSPQSLSHIAQPSFDCDLQTVLRIAVEADQRNAVEAFSQELMPLITSGPQGITGYAQGRPKCQPVFRYWPCLIASHLVTSNVDVIFSSSDAPKDQAIAVAANIYPKASDNPQSPTDKDSHFILTQSNPERLIQVAYGRSGDKGIHANVGILVRNPTDYPRLLRWLTVQRVADYFQALNLDKIERFELANLGGVNFILYGALRRSGQIDSQGKGLAQLLLAMPLDQSW